MLAIVGGTGLYDLPGLEVAERFAGATPFGAPGSTGTARPADSASRSRKIAVGSASGAILATDNVASAMP